MSRLGRLDYYRFLILVYGKKSGTITRSWSDPAIVDLSELSLPMCQGCYPLDFSRDDHGQLLMDPEGIPMIDYANLGRQYNPWFVGHIALGCYTRWRRNRRSNELARFRKLADWLVTAATPCEVGVRWLYQFDWFGADAPWFSGLSQAHAVSVLLRASHVFSNSLYADVARKGIDVMIAPIEMGGTAQAWVDGVVSFEEHVSVPRTSILNGHLFSVLAAWDAYRFFGDEEYERAFHQGVGFVERFFHLYDVGFWSRYSIQRRRLGLPDVASTHYHGVHVAQLEAIGAITGSGVFRELSKRFSEYQRSSVGRRKAILCRSLVKVLG